MQVSVGGLGFAKPQSVLALVPPQTWLASPVQAAVQAADAPWLPAMATLEPPQHSLPFCSPKKGRSAADASVAQANLVMLLLPLARLLLLLPRPLRRLPRLLLLRRLLLLLPELPELLLSALLA